MAGDKRRLISLIGSAVLAVSLAAAHASPGSGSGGDDDFDQSDWDSSGSGNDEPSDWDDDADDDHDDDDDRENHDDDDDDRRDRGHHGGGGDHDRRDRAFHAGADEPRDRDLTLFEVEYDELGDAYVARQVLLSGSRADISAARRLGFEVLDTIYLRSFGTRVARLKTPRGASATTAIAQLRQAAPAALIARNTIYRQSQSFVESRPARNHSMSWRFRPGTLIGVIDTGVDAEKLPQGALTEQRGFVGNRPTARDHGLAVAAIAAEHGARVQVADVFGQSTDGALAASASSILAALDWMIENDIAVINISIEGPNNPLIAETVRHAASRGHIVIAAAGNGGPVARPAFPAAFDGVVAVTAIDEHGRPYLRANRGSYIDFAAEGVNVAVATPNENLVVSGTSFAAPRIAAAFAQHLQRPSPRGAANALAAMRNRAEDLGEPGHDAIYGWGAIRD